MTERTPQTRTAVDILVQAATVDLFRSHGVAVAPMTRRQASGKEGAPRDVLGSIRFDGAAANGMLSLLVSPETLEQTRGASLRVFQAVDWGRELVNQLMGRLKNRLLRYQVLVRPDLASATLRGSLLTSGGDYYPFRTLKGEIGVILSASIDQGRFVYATAELANEGDVLLF